MVPISTLLFILTALGAVLLSGWGIMEWTAIEPALMGRFESREQMAPVLDRQMLVGAGLLAALALAYVLSFDSRRPRRPNKLIGAAAFLAGAAAAVPIRTAFYVYEVLPDVAPDEATIGLALGGGLALAGLLFGFELANRALWPRCATWFDQRHMPAMTLFCNRVALLFNPGQSSMLRSVALARFRRGVRADAVETLEALYDAGQRDPELLEALCKYAGEQKDRPARLHYLRELHELVPDEPEIRSVLIDELIDQGQHAEALRHIEEQGVPEEQEALETYGVLLLAERHWDRATDTANRLGELEGIPFRRSQRLLLDAVAEAPRPTKALNILAAQADRMARRDQKVRWLEKSLDADPSQRHVREQLLDIHREAGRTDRLEELLAMAVRENPRDQALHFELAEVLRQNEKNSEALEELEMIVSRPGAPARAHHLQALILYDIEKWDAAAKAVERGLAANPTQEDQRQLLHLRKQIEKAILSEEVSELLEEADRNPGELGLQLAALSRLIEGNHTEKILALVDRTLANHPGSRTQILEQLRDYAEKPNSSFPILNLLADLLVADGQYPEALEVIKLMGERSIDKVATIREGTQKILRRSPHHLGTLKLLGDTYLGHGRFTEMIHSYSLYLAHGGEESEDIDRALAKAYMSLNDFENGRRFINQLLDLNPRDIELLEKAIPLALEGGQPEDAAEYLKKLELADPRHPDLKRLRERVKMGMGERRFAFLQRELEAGKGGAETLEQLGDIARDMGNYGNAITYFQRASRDRDNKSLARRCTAKLAYCYMKKRLDDLCTETLREIHISLEDDPQDLQAIMDILYDIGDMFLDLKMYERAERVFKQLCKIDAGYRDVLTKIEKLRR